MSNTDPGEPIRIEEINPPVVEAEPMFPPLAKLIPWPGVRLRLYSLWAVFLLAYTVVIEPEISDPDPKWLKMTVSLGSLFFTSVAGANVARRR